MVQDKEVMVLENAVLAHDVYAMRLKTEPPLAFVPGQFVNLQVDGCYLRRPISVCDWDSEGFTLIYKVVGQGTRRMAQAKPGDRMRALLPLGHGFALVDETPALLVGGGVGVPPLLALAKAFAKRGVRPAMVMGFRTARDVFYYEAFAAFCDVTLCTADGSLGQKGFVTDALPTDYQALYACGPEPMLRALHSCCKALKPGCAQFSFEARMGCGFGACMVCSCQTLVGAKRICVEGPVLQREEVLW